MGKKLPGSIAGSWFLLCTIFSLLLFATAFADDAPAPKKGQDAQSLYVTADHSKFPALQKKFNKGPEVTQACLSCHTEAAGQIMGTIHWTWLCEKDPKKQTGKGGLTLNNF